MIGKNLVFLRALVTLPADRQVNGRVTLTFEFFFCHEDTMTLRFTKRNNF